MAEGQFANRTIAPFDAPASDLRRRSAAPTQVFGLYGHASEGQGLENLYALLLGQGRMDPRLLASLQAQNARSTQQGQAAVRGRGAASGMSGSGLNQAMEAAIGAAGADRASNLSYQDIADSYKRNQENLGLMNQLVTQPQLGYATLRQQEIQSQRDMTTKRQAAKYGLFGAMLGAAGSAAGSSGGG